MRKVGDDPVDDVVKAVFKRGGVNEINGIMRTLVRNDQPVPKDLPPELRDYLTSTLALPKWADASKIKRGQEVFEEYGLLITLCLFCASLPSAYADAKAVKVLYLTAQLDTDARRRVMETGQFLIDACTVGGLGPKGKGLRAIQHVRLMHGAVRHLINHRGDQHPGMWNPAWGVPINQEDMAATILSFWYVVGEPMRRLGVELEDEEIDAYLHLWNVIGHMMGVLDEMRPHDAADAQALLDIIKRRRFMASPEGQHMTRALLVLLDQLTPTKVFDQTIPPLIRRLIGDATADLLLIPRQHLRAELEQLARVADWFSTHVLSLVGRDLPPRYHFVSKWAPDFGRELLESAFAFERGGERAPFDMPDHLARDWVISKPPRRK
jgi:ER-bound oxygenase mpaB/B'/Rubber oxygenase, catalytic domain